MLLLLLAPSTLIFRSTSSLLSQLYTCTEATDRRQVNIRHTSADVSEPASREACVPFVEREEGVLTIEDDEDAMRFAENES